MRRYRIWPTIVFVLLCVVAYIAVVVVTDLWVWPQFLRHGEPVTLGSQATAAALQAERAQFQREVITSFYILGGIALGLYLIFWLVALPRLTLPARRKIAKWVRGLSLTTYIGLFVIIWSQYFNNALLRSLPETQIILSIVFYLALLVLIIFVVYVIGNRLVSSDSELKYGVASVFVLIVETALAGSVVYSLWNQSLEVWEWLFAIFNAVPISGRLFSVVNWIDLLVSFIPLFAGVLLWVLMTYAAPPNLGDHPMKKGAFRFRTLATPKQGENVNYGN